MAIPAECLREILEPVPVTRVPQAGSFIGGLINVRGVVVPLADLRVTFGMTLTEATPDTRMLVLELPIAGDEVVVAILADKVHDVTGLDTSTLEPIPPRGHPLAAGLRPRHRQVARRLHDPSRPGTHLFPGRAERISERGGGRRGLKSCGSA
ncbi:chemotaxis protein CheW [Cereibacter changlensis]|uniref:chemotaxis protein CheW n=1 Tax=Cereibacter changlensis TaxID=402884 RepID=UPI00200AA570|nr:chemotaxis protein CheW [Cereibacter changlensis]